MTMSHSEMVDDLARFFFSDRIIFTEAGIGSRWLKRGSIPIPDVLTLNRSYSRPVPTIYEVKVSRQDFLSDLRSDKWQRYLPLCQKFYFAAPAGLLKKSEIPEIAGLLIRTADCGWKSIKAPRTLVCHGWDLVNVQALLMAGAYAGERVRRLSERIDLEENVELGDRAQALGCEVARAINRLQRGEASGSEDGAKVLQIVASAFGTTVDGLLAMEPHDLRQRVWDRDRVIGVLETLEKVSTFLKYSHKPDDIGKLKVPDPPVGPREVIVRAPPGVVVTVDQQH